MSSRFTIRLHSSWQPSFKTYLAAQQYMRNASRCDLLVPICSRYGFSTTAQDQAQRRTSILQTPKRASPKRSQILVSGSQKPAAYEHLTEKLAFRASPTLLYRTSANNNYLFGCYAVGGGLFALAWLNFQTQFHIQPGDVPQWVPSSISIGSFMIAGASLWMFLKPQNMVQAISCLPSLAKPGPGPGSRYLLLQIERTPALPFKQPKLVTVPPGDVTISSHVFHFDAEQQLQAKVAEIARRKERLHAFARANLLTLPFRQAKYWILRGLMGIKSAFTTGQFHYLHVRGNNRVWKLDKDPAWALDDGRALDKLVKLKLG